MEERKKQVDFTIEYTTSNQVVVVKKDSNITNLNDIKDKRISVQLGTVADQYVTKNYKNVLAVPLMDLQKLLSPLLPEIIQRV